MRFQSYTRDHNDDGECYGESSAFVEIDRGNPAFYCDCSDLPSLARQEFADECDINKIMERYEATGVVTHVNKSEPRYFDVSNVPDLQEALTLLHDADRAFMSLPAAARREFDNDPVKFVEFAGDPANIDRMRSWGLAPPLPVDPPPQRVEIVNPPGQAPEPAG